MDLKDKLAILRQKIAEKERILVAYSGGVDSGLLAKISHDVLGDNALCVIMDSETLPGSELSYARKMAQSLGLNLMVLKHSALSSEQFSRNLPDRCFHCKKEDFSRLRRLANERGIACLADGANLSDCADYRPGLLACEEIGVWHPFIEAGITKEEIRELARLMGLPFWNKPSAACLSSRIPYGERITAENLKRVELAEDFLKSLGFGQLRVRSHGDVARIELPADDLEKAFSCRTEISKRLRSIGFTYVALDMDGFRSRRMNEVLTGSAIVEKSPQASL